MRDRDELRQRLSPALLSAAGRRSSRRSLLGAGLKLGLGGTAAAVIAGSPALRHLAMAQTMDFKNDVDVLNYALTLEHLEYAFYRDGVGQFQFGNDPFGNPIKTYLEAIRDHEGAHVETLTKVITDLGGTPVKESTYDFGYTDAQSFLKVAAALENTGVMAYDGAGKFIENPDLLTAAGGIVAVEARHAAYLNLLTGEIPFPAGFEQAKSKDEILKIAGQFIKG